MSNDFINFPMDTKDGVKIFLKNVHAIKERMFYSGDIDALILLIDFETALVRSKLSNKELYVLHNVFFLDRKRVDVAEELGVKKQTVQKVLERCLEKITKQYKISGVKYD